MNKIDENRLTQLKNDRDLIDSEISRLMNMSLSSWIQIADKIDFRMQARELKFSLEMIKEKIDELEFEVSQNKGEIK